MLYEDMYLAVVWKRAGLATNGAVSKGCTTLEALLPSVVSRSEAEDALPAPATVPKTN